MGAPTHGCKLCLITIAHKSSSGPRQDWCGADMTEETTPDHSTGAPTWLPALVAALVAIFIVLAVFWIQRRIGDAQSEAQLLAGTAADNSIGVESPPAVTPGSQIGPNTGADPGTDLSATELQSSTPQSSPSSPDAASVVFTLTADSGPLTVTLVDGSPREPPIDVTLAQGQLATIVNGSDRPCTMQVDETRTLEHIVTGIPTLQPGDWLSFIPAGSDGDQRMYSGSKKMPKS